MSKLSTASRFSPIFRTSGNIQKGARAGAVALVLAVPLLLLPEAWARVTTMRGPVRPPVIHSKTHIGSTLTDHANRNPRGERTAESIRKLLDLEAQNNRLREVEESWRKRTQELLDPPSRNLGDLPFPNYPQIETRHRLIETNNRFPNYPQIETRHRLIETNNSRLREKITQDVNDILSPELAELLRKDPRWTSDLRDSTLTAEVGESKDRLILAASKIDTSDVTVRARKPLVYLFPFRVPDLRDTGIIPLSPEDQSLARSYYRYYAIRYVAQALSGIESKQTYSSADEFAADARSQLRQPGVRERPEPVTDLDTELAARARQVTYRLDSVGNGDRLHMEDSDYRPGDDLSGVRFYEAEVTVSLP